MSTQAFRIRVWLSESRFTDTIIMADFWFNAEALGKGQSPIGRAVFLGNA